MATDQPQPICHSWWTRDEPVTQRFNRLVGKHSADLLVIGAGITGLSTAIELARRGRKVIVCEAEAVGAGTTAGSSGHLDAHPEMGPKALVNQLGAKKAALYTSARLEAIQTIRNYANDDCGFYQVPGYRYTEAATDESTLREELEFARQIGLNASWCDDVPISRAACGYRIDGLARLDCGRYLRRLVDVAIENGVVIFEKTLVAGPTEKHVTSLRAGEGEVQFDQVVCATHCNYTKADLLYAATPPYQSYLLVAEVRQPPEDALFWDNSEPYYYIRRLGDLDQSLILVGGCDHRTGQSNETDAMNRLEDWTQQRFDVNAIIKRWSAELFEPTDGLPMIGLAPGKDNIWVATGLSGVGLTLGTAAARMIADAMDGHDSDLRKDLAPDRAALSTDWLVEQTKAMANVAERVLPARDIDVKQLDEGEGAVGKVNGSHVAVCRDENGCVHQFSPICPHMGGVVHWNEAEKTWDCPLHGGRFMANGERIYGPPEEGLNNP